MYDTLRELESTSRTDLTADEIRAIMDRYDMQDPEAATEDLVAGNLLQRHGDRHYYLTTLGIRTSLLLEAINGCDLSDVYRRLTQLDSALRAYELIREGMTKVFVRSLVHRPGFGRLYLCSPWINLAEKERAMLIQAVAQAEERRGLRPEILVITRPESGTRAAPPEGLEPFQDLGAELYLHSRLHTKLYIREPSSNGGYAMAIVGSQNLTRSHYIELGILINSDSRMINQLIAYFLELANRCYTAL